MSKFATPNREERWKQLMGEEKRVSEIPLYGWKAERSGGGAWWVLAPNDPGDHEYQDDYEPILEASGVFYNFEQIAKLAASAPELLEACKKAYNFLDSGYSTGPSLGEVENSLREAVMKAEGREHGS